MAEFKVIGGRKLGVRKLTTKGNTVYLNRSKTTMFSFAKANVKILLEKDIRCYTSQRGVISTTSGVQVLPYFKDRGVCKVVMVEQFRIAVNNKTTEAPGGELDYYGHVRKSMARELKEETNIDVATNRIKIVLNEHLWPSMTSGSVWGGVVRIKKSEIPSSVLRGEFNDGEYTIPIVMSLNEILKRRDKQKIRLDLWTSRLLDEVAKKVGLLVRKY